MSDSFTSGTKPSNGQRIALPDGWKLTDADSRYGDDYRPDNSPMKGDDAPLGILSLLEGKTFVGGGVNMLFWPNNGTSSNTTFHIPVNPPPPTSPNTNVLEINLFEETLCFTKAVGTVPNRGFQQQGDISLNAIMYLQTVNDVTNTHTGKPDGKPCPIHAENGMFLHVPATTNDPNIGATIGRLGSIPHGVAINLQGFEPNASATVAGPPDITHDPCLTTPFQIPTTPGTKNIPHPFASLKAENNTTSRIPQNLDIFVQQRTLSDAILADPTILLTELNKTRKITSTITLTMSSTNLTNSTKSTDVPTGGGVVGNAFLDGIIGKPNASPFSVDFTLWIETVAYEVRVPRWKPVEGGKPVEVRHEGGMKFVLHPPSEIHEERTVVVEVVELQYLQMVMLQFGGLTWPHPSVSTLKPEVVVVAEGDGAWKGL